MCFLKQFVAVCRPWKVPPAPLATPQMKLGMHDIRARGYKVVEQILNICINYAN